MDPSTGSRERLSASGSRVTGGPIWSRVPDGAILRVIALEKGMVRLAWNQETVALFAGDLERRGRLLWASGAQAG
jgi:hypothetical protein